MGKMISYPLSKNYTFPKQLREKKKLPLSLTKVDKVHPNNNIPVEYRCDTYSFSNGKQVQPEYYPYQMCRQLKIVTYNVWFEAHNAKNRFLYLIKLLEDSDADFICLQQATQEFLNLLRKSYVFKEYYLGKYTMHWYDTVIISKFKCTNYKVRFRQTFMQRSLLISQLAISQKDSIIVASAHFQSMQNTSMRISQLKESFYYLQSSMHSVLVGDFNFDDNWKENQFLHKDYRDLWLSIHKKPVPTMLKTPKFAAWRPDHILVKGSNTQDSKIFILGDFTIPPFEHDSANLIEQDGVVRTPSDHLGLIADIAFT